MAQLSYRGRDWPDMSEFVAHFTKGATPIEAFDNLIAMMSTGRIEGRSPMGLARKVTTPVTQAAACFSEVPLNLVARIAERRSPFGLGFHHDVMTMRGGSRVWYVDLESVNGRYLGYLLDQHLAAGPVSSDPFWRLAPLIDRPGDYGGKTYRFEWEREWRVVEAMNFQAGDLGLVFCPENLHSDLRAALPTTKLGFDGGVADPAILDPSWSPEQIVETLKQTV